MTFNKSAKADFANEEEKNWENCNCKDFEENVIKILGGGIRVI